MVVTQKIVSKAEGRTVDLATIEPSDFARQFAEGIPDATPALSSWSFGRVSG